MSLVSDWSAADAAARLSGTGRARARKKGSNWFVCCPAHADRTPSLSLSDGKNGLLYHCFGGCASTDVFAALRAILCGDSAPVVRASAPKEKIDNFVPIIPAPASFSPSLQDFNDNWHGAPSTVWTYRTAEGLIHGWVARYDLADGSKEVVPWLWGEDAQQGFVGLRKKGFPDPRPLYRLDRLDGEPERTVIYTEGEKAADAAQFFFPEWIGTTHPGGVNAWHKADHRVLKGRQLILAPDHDGAGYEMALHLQQLRGLGLRDMRMLRWPTHVTPVNGVLVPEPYVMEPGDDLADHRKRGWTPGLLREALRTSGHPLCERLDVLGVPFEVIDFEG